MGNVVLFIDEQSTEVEAACDVLEAKYGKNSFYYAQTSKKGLAYLEENSSKVCCISLDLLMPLSKLVDEEDRTTYKLEGLYVLKLIRDSFPTMPVVCYSWVEEEFATDFIKKNNALYIKKGNNNGYQPLLKFFYKHLLQHQV